MDVTRRKFIINAGKVAYAAPLVTSIAVSPSIASAGSSEFDGGGNNNGNNGWHGNNPNGGGNGNGGGWDDSYRNPDSQ